MKYEIDAKNKILGRVASEIAVILQGKKSPKFEKNLIGADGVVVKNASGIQVSGRKSRQKVYYSHTAYQGHLKKTKFYDLFAKSPEKVLWKAVYNMLPKNRLRMPMMKKLTIER